jgi:hypothetical protein
MVVIKKEFMSFQISSKYLRNTVQGLIEYI